MVDLTTEMAGLWAALGAGPAHRGRVIQFACAGTGEGTSTVAREFARLAAVRARKPVWLVDADLAQQGQQEIVAAEVERFGRMGSPAAASPDGSVFYAVTPPVLGRDGRPVDPARLMTARPCLGGRLWVTRFRAEMLRSGQRAEPLPDPRYWDVMRRHADTVVIDAPAADRNDVAITLAPMSTPPSWSSPPRAPRPTSPSSCVTRSRPSVAASPASSSIARPTSRRRS
jgi:hypothetical protein